MRKKTKFLFVRSSIIALFLILSGRIWYVQVVMGSYYKAQGDTSKIRTVPVEALRGIIYDRYGRQLVWNAPSWQIEIVPHGIPVGEGAHIYAILSHLLGGNPAASTIAADVQANLWHPYAGAIVKENVSSDTAMVIKQLHVQLPGVRAVLSSVRQYRQDAGYAISHLLGYTTAIAPDTLAKDRRLYPVEHVDPTDQAGQFGIEFSMDKYLHGVNGREQVEVDAGERPIRTLYPGTVVPGDSVYLTLDWKLQQQVTADLQAALQHLNLRQGVAILEDVHSGQIFSMASLPSYNNNWFAGGITEKRYVSLQKDPAHPLDDLALQGQFAPGSTYKVITATAALQTGVAAAYGQINDTGQIKPCATCTIFHGWMPGGLGPVDTVMALARSSDIYFYTVTGGNPSVYHGMPSIGGARLAYWARQYGLGQATGIELRGEAPGFVPTPHWFNSQPAPSLIKNVGDSWTIGYNYNSAIGQGFDLATPLQMVNVAATIANGGTLYQPRVVQRIVGRVLPSHRVLSHQRLIQPYVPTVVRRNFIDPGNVALIQRGMRLSVTPLPIGTSFNVVDPRINAAGKTGTAEDNPRPAHAWWIGYAPYNNPKVAIVVMVPNAGGEGAYVAAPIAHKLLEDYFHLPPLTANWLADVQQRLVGSVGGNQ